jgi:hypothetical protein
LILDLRKVNEHIWKVGLSDKLKQAESRAIKKVKTTSSKQSVIQE